MSLDFPHLFTPPDEELRAFQAGVPELSAFQTPEMVEVYRHARGCKPIVLALADRSGGLRASLVSILFRDTIGVTHATIRGGPICLESDRSVDDAKRILERHEELTGSATLYSRIYPMWPGACGLKAVADCGFVRTEWLNYLIPLEAPEAMWGNLSKARRKGIRNAEKDGVRVKDITSTQELQAAIQLVRGSARRNRIPMQHASLFEAIREQLVPKGLARIVLAILNDQPIAARVFLVHRTVIYDWYAGSDAAFHDHHPDELLVWEALKWGHSHGLAVFDFGGAGVPGVRYGPREFKRRFNGEEVELGRFTRFHYPRITKTLQRMYRVYQGGAKT